MADAAAGRQLHSPLTRDGNSDPRTTIGASIATSAVAFAASAVSIATIAVTIATTAYAIGPAASALTTSTFALASAASAIPTASFALAYREHRQRESYRGAPT